MKTAIYKLAGDVPELAKGLELELPEAESMEDVLAECQDEISVIKAAQSAIDISKQRIARSLANGEDVEKMIAEGKGADDIQVFIQGKLDEYKFGARTAVGGGAGAAAKAAVKTVGSLKAATEADPELAAKLAALGISL